MSSKRFPFSLSDSLSMSIVSNSDFYFINFLPNPFELGAYGGSRSMLDFIFNGNISDCPPPKPVDPSLD